MELNHEPSGLTVTLVGREASEVALTGSSDIVGFQALRKAASKAAASCSFFAHVFGTHQNVHELVNIGQQM